MSLDERLLGRSELRGPRVSLPQLKSSLQAEVRVTTRRVLSPRAGSASHVVQHGVAPVCTRGRPGWRLQLGRREDVEPPILDSRKQRLRENAASLPRPIISACPPSAARHLLGEGCLPLIPGSFRGGPKLPPKRSKR